MLSIYTFLDEVDRDNVNIPVIIEEQVTLPISDPGVPGGSAESLGES